MEPESEKTERVHVLLDYENVRRIARSQFLPLSAPFHAGMVQPVELAELLVSRRIRPSSLEAVSVFRGRPVPQHQPTASQFFDRYTADWVADSRCTVVHRPLKYHFPNRHDPAYFEASEKGIDVALAMKVVETTLAGEVDAIIIFSNDTDLFPAVEFAYDNGMHVEVAAWDGSTGLRFPADSGKRLWCHFLKERDFLSVRQDDFFQ